MFEVQILTEEVRNEIKEEIVSMSRKPCLAILQIGSNSESNKSINIKKVLCKEVGIETLEYLFPEQTTQETILLTSNPLLLLFFFLLLLIFLLILILIL